MKRKVVLQGGKTFMVSLPKKWAEGFFVKKGEELECTIDGGRVCFSAHAEPRSERVEISAKRLSERALRYILSGLHKSGYDEIVVRDVNDNTLRIIEDILKNLYIGFAIVEQSDRACVLKCISKELPSEFDAALHRAFQVTLSLGESMLEAIKAGQFNLLSNLLGLEKTNNQLTNFCERLLNKNPAIAPKMHNFFYVIIWNLEKVCDDYKYICKLEYKSKLNSSLILGLEQGQALLRGYYELFYGFDIQKITELYNKKRVLEEALFSLLPSLNGPEQRLCFHLLSLLQKLTEFSASMTAIRFH